jgi:hypothetical protein
MKLHELAMKVSGKLQNWKVTYSGTCTGCANTITCSKDDIKQEFISSCNSGVIGFDSNYVICPLCKQKNTLDIVL